MLDKGKLYRLPWSMNDNPIAWLEITDICNMHCEGCYRQHLTGHKPLEQIKEEILFFKKWRNPDNVSIAGGEPLVHPEIMEIVSFIAENDIKPIVLTNAKAMTPEVLRELKRAGCAGFTVHIDSHQTRPGWTGKNEAQLNELRQQCADMIAAVGGMYVIFNGTVYPSSVNEIPDVVRWAKGNMDKVQGLVFITYRTATYDDNVGRDAADQQVDLSQLSYTTASFDEEFVTAPEVIEQIQREVPNYEPAAYLGGSIRHDSFKWTAGCLIGSKGTCYGSFGRKTMELAQVWNHLTNGRYLAYVSTQKIGGNIFFLSPFDPVLRRAFKARLGDLLRHPGKLFDRVGVQSYGIIQAPDLQPDGRADMCDSCPDMTVWNGTLINSCRMDEYRLFGGFLTLTEKQKQEVERQQAEAQEQPVAK